MEWLFTSTHVFFTDNNSVGQAASYNTTNKTDVPEHRQQTVATRIAIEIMKRFFPQTPETRVIKHKFFASPIRCLPVLALHFLRRRLFAKTISAIAQVWRHGVFCARGGNFHLTEAGAKCQCLLRQRCFVLVSLPPVLRRLARVSSRFSTEYGVLPQAVCRPCALA